MQGEGYTLMTRVDPEITVSTTSGQPIIESDTNSGAVHGFKGDTVGTVQSHWRELRPTQSGTLSGNTNARLWKTHDPEWLRFRIDSPNVDTATHYADPTRNGEFMVVSICVRRSGPIEMEDVDAPVVKLRILRQQRLKKSGSNIIVDSRGERFLRFSLIPRTDVDDSAFSDYSPRQVGTDSLPRLFIDMNLYAPADSTMIEMKLDGDNYSYKEMPLALPAEVTPSLAGREMVWQFMKDVRGLTGNGDPEPDIREEIVITGRMLGVLPDDPSSAIGTGANQFDGESRWTVYEGLVVFSPLNATTSRKKLVRYHYDQAIPSNSDFGLGSSDANSRFIQNGPRGNETYEYPVTNPGVITDLNLEVEYLGGTGVDVDYVTFQTPNTRALLC